MTKGEPGSRLRPRLNAASNPSVWVAFALLALPPLYFAPAVAGKLVLALGDGWSHGLLARMLTAEFLRRGELPLWNPHTFAGMPLLASIQPGVLYPLNWLFVVLPPGLAINLVVLVSYQLALLGSYCFARSLQFSRVAATCSALTYAFGGFLVAHLDQTNVIAVASWLPWLLWAVEGLFQRGTWRYVVLGALMFMLQFFAGHPQTSGQLLFLVTAYFLFSLLFRQPAAGRLRFALFGALQAACGILLCAVQFLPTRELQQQGERAALSYEYFSTLSMPAQQLLTLVLPFFFGGGYGPLYHAGAWNPWWLAKWGYAYAGISGLLLAGLGFFSVTQRKQLCFWLAVALLAMLLAQGAYLPWELNRWLYRLPLYNLFRGSYRHLLEVNFALAVLAGIGVDCLWAARPKLTGKALGRAFTGLALVVGATMLAYRFGGRWLRTETPPPVGSWLNPEAYIPLLFFAFSLPMFYWVWRKPSRLSALALVTLLLLDLASFGWFSHWRVMTRPSTAVLSDPPVVTAIKQREPDLAAFRVVSYTAQIYGSADYELLNHQNLSMVRGLQSVNGYDPLRPTRLVPLAGKLEIGGMTPDAAAFGLADAGFNLLNVKYLICERRGPLDPAREPLLHYAGLPFQAVPMFEKFSPAARHFAWDSNTTATELALVTVMANAGGIPDGAPVLKFRFYVTGGQVFERELLAGRDTGEWAYDRADVRAAAKHRRPTIAESFPVAAGAEIFNAYRYLARLPFPRAAIERVEAEYLRPEAELSLVRATLYDSETRTAAPLDNIALPAERWHKLAQFGQLYLYENLKALPRAWFVKRALLLPQAAVLQTINTGRLPDGGRFDPAEVVLLEREDYPGRAADWLPANAAGESAVQVTRYAPQRIELAARTEQPALLVLSEMYYRGWEAWVDGVRTPVERVNHTLRGVLIPAGAHRVEFRYQAHSFWRGLQFSALGAAILLAGLVWEGKLRRRPVSASTG